MTELLKTLCSLNGVTGCEDEVRGYIFERVLAFADEVKTDPIGNIMAFKKGKMRAANRLMVCAHMDEVGLIIKSVTDEGYLKFETVGGIDRRLLPGKTVAVGRDCLPGVIGIKAVHLTTSEERKGPPKPKDMYIDIGAKNKETAEKLVSPGDYAAFMSDIVVTADSLRAKAIDDRVGCAVMLGMLESQLSYDMWFAFTSQEEVGLRGADSAAFAVMPDIALILETTTAADLPLVKGASAVSRLDSGVVLSYMDSGTIYDRALFEHIRGIADENNIKWQVKSMIAGGTDAGRIHISRSGVRCAGLAVPVRYLHSAGSLASLSDIESLERLAYLAIQTLPAITL